MTPPADVHASNHGIDRLVDGPGATSLVSLITAPGWGAIKIPPLRFGHRSPLVRYLYSIGAWDLCHQLVGYFRYV